MKKINNYISKFCIYTGLSLLAIVTLFPIIYAVFGSLKTNMELFNNAASILPDNPTFEHYKALLEPDSGMNYPRMFFTSTWFTAISVLVRVVGSSMAGYVFARLNFPFKKIIFVTFSSLMFFSIGTMTIYPLFEILGVLNLDKSLWGLVVVRVFGISIVDVYLIISYLKTIPVAIDEAAEIDGCSFFGIYRRIHLPLLKPILATVGILAFRDSWNEYLMPLLFTLTKPEQRTLMVGIVSLKNSSAGSASWGIMLSSAMIALLPVLIIYIFGNKMFIQGMVSGAVKE